MLYKILLSIQYEPISQQVRGQISNTLRSKNWTSVANSELSWVAEVISQDLLSARMRVERDLSTLASLSLSDFNYAFQLSLGNVNVGTLKPQAIEKKPFAVFSLKESSEDLLQIWQQKTHQKTNLCCERRCTKSDIEGALVYDVVTKKNGIIPLCSEHKNSDKEIVICSSFEMVETV